MQPAAQELLKRLQQADWFAAVGQPLEDAGVLTVSSWEEALKSCQDKRWKRLVNYTVSDRLTKYLRQHVPARYQEWNPTVADVRPLLDKLLRRKLPGGLSEDVAAVVEDQLFWPLLHAFLELEFADAKEPGFYVTVAEWCRRGRFPCGWEGTPTRGGLIVY